MIPTVSDQYEFVIGVDTHAASHTFALVAGKTGAVLDQPMFPTTSAGLTRAQHWIDRRVEGAPTLVVIEGTGSFGAILTQRLQAAGCEVVEAARRRRCPEGTGVASARTTSSMRCGSPELFSGWW